MMPAFRELLKSDTPLADDFTSPFQQNFPEWEPYIIHSPSEFHYDTLGPV